MIYISNALHVEIRNAFFLNKYNEKLYLSVARRVMFKESIEHARIAIDVCEESQKNSDSYIIKSAGKA